MGADLSAGPCASWNISTALICIVLKISSQLVVPSLSLPLSFLLPSSASCSQDVANTFAPSVAARALTMKQALLVAGIFEFTGAVLMVRGLSTGPASMLCVEFFSCRCCCRRFCCCCHCCGCTPTLLPCAPA